MSLEDSPSAAPVILDAARAAKAALLEGRGGALQAVHQPHERSTATSRMNRSRVSPDRGPALTQVGSLAVGRA
jgi:hypothetical protein